MSLPTSCTLLFNWRRKCRSSLLLLPCSLLTSRPTEDKNHHYGSCSLKMKKCFLSVCELHCYTWLVDLCICLSTGARHCTVRLRFYRRGGLITRVLSHRAHQLWFTTHKFTAFAEKKKNASRWPFLLSMTGSMYLITAKPLTSAVRHRLKYTVQYCLKNMRVCWALYIH